MAAGAVLLVEMSYRVVDAAGAGNAHAPPGDRPGCRDAVAVDRRRRAARRRLRCFSRDVGPGGGRMGARRRRSRCAGDGRTSGAAMRRAHRRSRRTPRIRARASGVQKRFGATLIIRGVSLDVRRGERLAIIGPNGAGKSTLFNLISGRLRATQGLDPPQRRGDRRRAAVSRQPARAGAQLPGDEHLSAPFRLREHPLQRAVVARLQATTSGAARTGSTTRNERTERDAGADPHDGAPRHAGRRAHVRRAARARDRHHDRRRRRA